MQVHKPSRFIFFIFTTSLHELEKGVVKKKIKGDGKSDKESKVAMKKDAVQSSDESIQLYGVEQKSLQEKIEKHMLTVGPHVFF